MSVCILQDVHVEMEQMAGSVQLASDAGIAVQLSTSAQGQDAIQQQIK